MLKSLFTSATGMKAQQMYVDNIANNLANVNTSGFKRSHLNFQDLIYDTLISPGAETVEGYQSPSGLQIGSGVRHVSTTKIFSQGLPQETRRELDITIDGEGFYQITHPDSTRGTVYSRDGSFGLDSQGRLVTGEGFYLNPQITIPGGSTHITISRDGIVTYAPAGDNNSRTQAGQIQLATFANAAGLENLGHNLYAETAASGSATTGNPGENGVGALRQGYLEGSNVDVVTELVNLIIAQRAYEINSRAIRTSDSMLEQANNVVR